MHEDLNPNLEKRGRDDSKPPSLVLETEHLVAAGAGIDESFGS